MKALIIILAVLLVARHPGAVAAVLAAEAAVVGGLGWLTWRGLLALVQPSALRRAS